MGGFLIASGSTGDFADARPVLAGFGCGAVEASAVWIGRGPGGAGARGGEGKVLGFFYCLWRGKSAALTRR